VPIARASSPALGGCRRPQVGAHGGGAGSAPEALRARHPMRGRCAYTRNPQQVRGGEPNPRERRFSGCGSAQHGRPARLPDRLPMFRVRRQRTRGGGGSPDAGACGRRCERRAQGLPPSRRRRAPGSGLPRVPMRIRLRVADVPAFPGGARKRSRSVEILPSSYPVFCANRCWSAG
jgi:hypothetical protein